MTRSYFEHNEPHVVSHDLVIFEDASVPDMVSDLDGIKVVEHNSPPPELARLMAKLEAA